MTATSSGPAASCGCAASTVVQVPEIDGTFLEVETMAEADDVPAALEAVRDVIAGLGVGDEEFTTELYTDAVRAARASFPASGPPGAGRRTWRTGAAPPLHAGGRWP
jgi:hypothetical protein